MFNDTTLEKQYFMKVLRKIQDTRDTIQGKASHGMEGNSISSVQSYLSKYIGELNDIGFSKESLVDDNGNQMGMLVTALDNDTVLIDAIECDGEYNLALQDYKALINPETYNSITELTTDRVAYINVSEIIEVLDSDF